MIGLGGYGGNCSPCSTETYAEIDWTKEQKTITFTMESNVINFQAIQDKSIIFNLDISNEIKFDINKSKDITFSINTNDIKFTVAQLACG